MMSMFSLRPPQVDPNIRPLIRDPREQLVLGHALRLALYASLEVLLLTPLLFQFFSGSFRSGRGWEWFFIVLAEIPRTIIRCIRRRITLWEGVSHFFSLFFGLPTGGWGWIALGFAYLAKGLAIWTRYNATFAAGPKELVILLIGHGVAGVLVSLAFLSRAGGPLGDGPFAACELPHHCSAAILSGLLASLADAGLSFYLRGYQSSRGSGPFRHASPDGYYSVLSRGFDQALFDAKLFIKPIKPPAYGPPTPRYARMLIPPLPEPPDDLPNFVHPGAPEWMKYLARHVLKRLYLFWVEAEIPQCLWKSVLTFAAVGLLILPCEGALRMLGALLWDESLVPIKSTIGSGWQAAPSVIWTTSLVATYAYISLSISTLLLYHILRQPVEFSKFTTVQAPVLKYWLEMGWSMLLRDPRPGQASALVSRDEDIWREEMENYQQVLYRTAVLANNVYFPPQIEAHNRISVMEKWYRAHAFQDLAILADVSAGRRKWIYFEMRLWLNHCRPLIVVVNALTLQLELQMEASGRVEGGVKSPLDNLHNKLGVSEPSDAELIAKLIIESEVQRRLEDLLQRRMQNGEPIEELPEILLLPYRTSSGGRTLRNLALPTIDIQIVEMAALALGSLFKNSIGSEKGTKMFEDPKGVSRHSIPAALAALLSSQLAIHLYSTTVLSEAGTSAKGGGPAGSIPPRFTVMRDRPSVVIPKFCGVSRAIDQAIELIVVNFYESDFKSFTFAPLYAKALKTYVECLRNREES